MCDPFTIASVVVVVATTVATTVNQYQQAEAQNDYQVNLNRQRNEEIENNATRANDAYIRQVSQLQLRDIQSDAKADAEIQRNQLRAAEAAATAKVASGEAGVSGLSVDALLADFQRQDANFRDDVRDNRAAERIFLQDQSEGLRAQAEGRIASIRPFTPKPIAQPDYVGAALRIAGRGLNAAQSSGQFNSVNQAATG